MFREARTRSFACTQILEQHVHLSHTLAISPLQRQSPCGINNVVPEVFLQQDIDQQETRQVPWGLIELIWREKISPVEIDVQLGYHRKGDIENKRSGQTDRGRMSRSLV